MIYELCVGDIQIGMERLLPVVNRLYCAPITQEFDIVVAEVKPPYDRDFYQAHKAIEHARLAVREGGVLILVAECPEGVGPENFHRVIRSGNNPKDIMKRINENYILGAHKVSRLLSYLAKNKLYIVSQLDDEVVRDFFSEPFENFDEALTMAVTYLKLKDPRILLIREATRVVPLLEQEIVLSSSMVADRIAKLDAGITTT